MFLQIAIFCTVMCHFYVLAQPRFPCCPGSQQLTTLMSSYIVNFVHSVDSTNDKAKVCANVIDDVQRMKVELEALNRCAKGGGARVFDEIDDQLLNTNMWDINLDGCAYGFSFLRAMFALAATAAGHMRSTQWDAVRQNLHTQIGHIDAICDRFGIRLNKGVRFSEPYRGNDQHFEAPKPDEVINNPGQQSAYTK